MVISYGRKEKITLSKQRSMYVMFNPPHDQKGNIHRTTLEFTNCNRPLEHTSWLVNLAPARTGTPLGNLVASQALRETNAS